ncbi:hypothetical protein [Streptomyces sp. CBMA152]|uniref:hypothetical protein n=1 Tax=Streptomyces sp. CBMA152 TaxID=1896312 RepID=UPI0016617B26|nr:hypothetical protein [Streptomyces sp. CBMA152]MBD0747114.1 hypothetical protein [Streptomyces sp. CBMA152]
MSTIVIVVLIAVSVVVLAAVALLVVRGTAAGGRGLRRRFGPEYDRAVVLHDGDRRAAERELGERLKRHGSLAERPMPVEVREHYLVRWAGIQEQFVDSPRHATEEADKLMARLAEERGFPAAKAYDDQIAALSVHHAGRLDGYRRVHRAARGAADTEEMREAMIEARTLFEELLTAGPRHAAKRGAA